MKNKLALITAFFLLLALVLPATARAAGPVITLVEPAPPTAQFISGIDNSVSISASSSGASIISAEFQTFFNDPAGTFPAMGVSAQKPIAPGTAKAGASATADTDVVPADLPASAAVAIVVFGTVSSVNATRGEWQIGTPPLFVYEREDGSTSVQGAPTVGSEVRVKARRTLAPGPIIAETITLLGTGILPAPAPTVERSFLFNGTIQSLQAGAKSAGIKLGGTTWDVSGVPFRVDDANFPAVIEPGIGPEAGQNSAVTVQFTTQLPTSVNRNIALEVFSPQAPPPVSGVLHPNPVISTEPAPANLPPGSWKLVIIEGVVSANNSNGEWAIGMPPVFVYQSADTTVQGAPGAGSEVRVIATRTLAPGPIVAREIVALSTTPRIPGQATVSNTFLFNGTIETTDNVAWTIGGNSFVVNDSQAPAVLQSGLSAGSAVTVEYRFVGAPSPDAELWVPMQLAAGTNLWQASFSPPADNTRTGFLFLRSTDAQQLVTNMVVPASLVVPPPPVPIEGGGGGGGGTVPSISLNGLAGDILLINTSGLVQKTVSLTTPGGDASLNIPLGTIISTASGIPPSSLSVTMPTTVPQPPGEKTMLAAHDFGPDGTTFTPPIILSLTYDQSRLPAGVSENDLVIAWWDGARWVTLETTVNTGTSTLSAAVSHFTVFGILAPAPPPPAPPPPPVVAPAPAPVEVSVPAPTTVPPTSAPAETPALAPEPVVTPVPPLLPEPTAAPANTNTWLTVGIIGAAVALIGLVFLYRRRRPNSR